MISGDRDRSLIAMRRVAVLVWIVHRLVRVNGCVLSRSRYWVFRARLLVSQVKPFFSSSEQIVSHGECDRRDIQGNHEIARNIRPKADARNAAVQGVDGVEK